MKRTIVQKEYLGDSDVIRRFGSRSRGSVLLLSLLILSAVLAATTVVGSFIVREVRSNRQLDNALLAFYASESGIEEGLWRASVDPKDPELLQERTATFDANTATVKRLGKNRGKSISYPFLANGETFTLDLYNPDSAARDEGDFASGVAVLAIEATGQLTLASCHQRAPTGGLAPCDAITTGQSYTSLSLDHTKAYRLAWKAGSGDVRDISFSGTRDGNSVDLSTPLTIESTGALTTSRQALRVTLITPSPLSGIPGGSGGEGGTGGGEGGGGGGGTSGTCPSGEGPTTPIVTSGDPPGSVKEDDPYRYDVDSTVEGSAGTAYTLLSTSPLSVDPNALVQMNATTGEIRWTPVNDQVGVHTVRYKVTEVCGGSLTQEFTVVVVNDPPIITSTPVTQAFAGQEYTYDVQNDNDEGIGGTFYTLSGTPPQGMTIDRTTGVISWPSPAPHPSSPDGRQFVTILADDTNGGFALQDFYISVLPDTSVLTLTWRPLQNQQVNTLSSPAVNEWWVALRPSSDPTDLFYTSDGGGTWQRRPEDTGLNLHNVIGVHFFDSSNGMAIGTTLQGVERLIWTDDGGEHWRQSNLNFEFTGTGSGVFAVPLFSNSAPNAGWFGSGGGRIAKTNDRGGTWNLRTTPTTKDIRTLFFFDDRKGWATTESELLKTIDGGTNWRSIPVPFMIASSLSFGTSTVGWATTGGTRFWKTDNGGETWSPRDIGKQFYGIHAFSDTHALAVGRYGAIFETTDGGQTWNAPTIHEQNRSDGVGPEPWFRKIVFRNSREGWILGDDGVIIHVTPGAP